MLDTMLLYGGCGPQANAFAHQKLFRICAEQFQAQEDNSFPSVISIDTPAELTNSKGIIHYRSYQNQFQYVIENLSQSFSIETIIPVCNSSAHSLQKFDSQYNIISLPKEAVNYLTYQNVSTAIVLCSFSSWENNIFSDIIPSTVKEQKLSEEEILCLENIIYSLMGSYQAQKVHTEFDRLIEQLYKKYQPDSIIIGCTELSMINQKILLEIETKYNFRFIDSLTCALQTTISNYYESI